ncbi:MAG: hypothetical protein J1F05_01510 [Muribaculaceae bacterium]|nr:hypothetical protein [Muribaculaceae bacterium]
MRKLTLFFKTVFALVLSIGSISANAELLGTHTFTADVEYLNGYDWQSEVFVLPNKFQITGTTASPSLDNFIRQGSSVYMTYSNGTLSFRSANLGFWSNYSGLDCTVGVATLEGSYNQTSSEVKWTVDSEGHIIIPDFSIVDINKGNIIMAKYTNCKVDGYPASETPSGPETYPTKSQLLGEYTFKANVARENTDVYTDLVPATLTPAEFTFTIGSASIEDFVGYTTGYIFYGYNETTGEITIQSNALGTGEGWYPDSYEAVQLVLADAEGTYPGFYRNGGNIMTWNVAADGTITIPDFTIIDNKHDNPVIARYTSCVVTKGASDGDDDDDTPGGGDDDAEYVAVNPTLSETETVGNYYWTIDLGNEMFQPTGTQQKIEVEVIKTANDDYYVKEVGETNYFLGNLIPFSYQDGAQNATFEPFYAGDKGETPVWFSVILSSPEIQGQYPITFTAEEGFTFNGTAGFGWFDSSKTDGLTPTGAFQSLFYLVSCEVIPVPANYPTIEELAGLYKFTAEEYTLNYDAYAQYFPKTFVFEIEVKGGQAVLVNWLYKDNRANIDYEQEIGELTNKQLVWKPNGVDWRAIAPVDGGYQGMSAITGNPLRLKVAEDGTITIPDFEIGPYQTNPTQLASVTVHYGNITVEPASAEDLDPEVDFTGSYELKGTKYVYTNGITEPEKSALDFTLVINENKQITSIGGYTLSDEEININKRNEGIVDGNQFILEASFRNGVLFQTQEPVGGEETGRQESWLLGGPNINEWDQLDDTNKVVFTLEDGTYKLEPFTIWHSYWVAQGEGSDATVSRVFELVFKWDDTVYSEYGTEDLEGVWSIPLNGHYQGSYSLNQFTENYDVTYTGNIVTFTSKGSDYHIVGELTSESTIKFSRAVVVPAIYSLYQVPYVFTELTNNIEELEEQEFTATYNAAEGTITFPEGCGLAYGRFTKEGKLEFWDDAYDFNGVARKVGGFTPVVTIDRKEYTIGADNITVLFDVTTEHLDIESVASWKANVVEQLHEGETDIQQPVEATVTVENGVATVVIPNLTQGNHDFLIALVACDEDGNEIATSNQRALSDYVGPNIAIRKTQGNGEAGEGELTVSFSISTLSGMPEGVTYKVRFIDNKTVTDDYAGDEYYAEAVIENKIVTATLTDLEAGDYDLKVALVAYDEDDNAIATSNNLEFLITNVTTGIDSIVVEGAPVRYYNLQGVEVANPAAGIYIKVEGSKTSKVVIK